MNYRILPPDEMLQARVALPRSKSVSNRLLVINALTPGALPLPPLADCDDTRVMQTALEAPEASTVDVGACGTAMRFLTALYAATPGREVTITGSERMLQRPIGTLVDALRHLGADIRYAGEEGFPPLAISGRRLKGGVVEIDAQVSSQFISALMMVAPTMEAPLELRLGGTPVSMPYIRLTAWLMEQRGVEPEFDEGLVRVPAGGYKPVAAEAVEADWSAASYWYELEALSMGAITLDGLDPASRQADVAVAAIFSQMGVTTRWQGEEGGIDLEPNPDQDPRLTVDMAACPDLVPAVAVTAALLGIPFRLTGLASLRIKECDRAAALQAELARLGIMTALADNTLSWELERRPVEEMPRFDAHDDHRMAMALAPVALFVPGIVVCGAESVAKSYPDYWEHLRAAGFTLEEVE